MLCQFTGLREVWGDGDANGAPRVASQFRVESVALSDWLGSVRNPLLIGGIIDRRIR